ncbi:MAG: methionyl-tRNA formyltransferase [Candidatus Gastranaerophilaceae bacterium]
MFNSNSKMKILFIGMPDMGVVCLNEIMANGKNIVGIVPPPKSDPSYPLLIQTAAHYKIPCIDFENNLKEPDFLEKVKKLNPDIAIVASYNMLLPRELFEIPPMGTINCHPSLLPDYRGGNPYFHVVNNNEKITGITYHFMDETFDTGDIIYQQQLPVFEHDTMGTLFNRLNYYCARFYVELLTKIENGENLPRIKQIKEGNLKIASKISPENGDSMINWTNDAASIERFIRALNPFYGGTTFFRGIMLRIWKGKYSNHINVSSLEPGKIVKTTEDMILISTGNGVFIPEILQLGTFFTSDTKDFIKMMSPNVGDIFHS